MILSVGKACFLVLGDKNSSPQATLGCSNESNGNEFWTKNLEKCFCCYLFSTKILYTHKLTMFWVQTTQSHILILFQDGVKPDKQETCSNYLLSVWMNWFSTSSQLSPTWLSLPSPETPPYHLSKRKLSLCTNTSPFL